MKQLSQLPVIKEVSASKPFGAIINETDVQDGTPVVREIYNDPLINIYKLLQLTGITPDGTEDGETNGVAGIPKYQIVEALQKLANVLNDVEQVLTLSSGVWSIPLNISLLPDKYVFVARASDAYVSGTFKGSTASPSYIFFSPGFNASDELLVIIDHTQVRAYSISGIFGNSANELFTLLGTPLGYNDANTLYYQEEGNLISDIPSVAYIQDIIRSDVSDTEVLVTDMFIMHGYLLCVVYFPTSVTYRFRQFSLGNLSESDPVTLTGATVPTGVDNVPYFYADGDYLYVTNKVGFNAFDNQIGVVRYTGASATLLYLSTSTIDATFVKTTNAAVKDDGLYTMIAGELNRFDLISGIKTPLGQFNGVVGQIFNYKDFIYFTTGEVAKKWY